MVVLRGDAVLPQDVVQAALEGRLDPRTAGIKEEDRHLRVVRGWRPASVLRLVAEIGHHPRPVVVVGDAGPCLLQFIQHLLVADSVPKPVHLEVERDIRMKRVIPDRKPAYDLWTAERHLKHSFLRRRPDRKIQVGRAPNQPALTPN